MSVYGSCHERKSKIVLVKNGSYTNESPSQTFMLLQKKATPQVFDIHMYKNK
jgi:hypothetical protein